MRTEEATQEAAVHVLSATCVVPRADCYIYSHSAVGAPLPTDHDIGSSVTLSFLQ